MGGKIDAVVLGLGPAVHLGLSKYFKGKNKNVKIVAFEPETGSVYAGGKQGKHKIIGIGPGFVTENFKRSQENLDEIIHVKVEIAG